MITYRVTGNYNRTRNFLKKSQKLDFSSVLDKYGKRGVSALSSATPVDTGKTASNWGYEIKKTNDGISIYWTNSNVNNGVPIAIILQYGHGTRNGGYVQGRDYINPAIRPIFDEIAEAAWKEVKDS